MVTLFYVDFHPIACGTIVAIPLTWVQLALYTQLTSIGTPGKNAFKASKSINLLPQ